MPTYHQQYCLQGGNQKLIAGGCFPVPSTPFLLFISPPSLSLPFLSIFFASKWPFKSSYRSDASSPSEKNDICSHQTRFLGSKYTKTAFAAERQPQAHSWYIYRPKTCPVAADTVLFLANEILKIEANRCF